MFLNREDGLKCTLSGNESDIVIAHAGGGIDNSVYTNSLEALIFSYSRGIKLFELDLLETEDGHLVASHSWEDYWNDVGIKNEGKITIKEFLSNERLDMYTHLYYQNINDFFEKNTDAILVTDKVTNIKKIASSFTFKNRIIVEVFDEEKINDVISLGMKPIISFTNYNRKEILRIKEKYGVNFFATSITNLPRGEDGQFLKQERRDYCMYLYTLNNPDDWRDLKEKNIADGVYTDFLSVDGQLCIDGEGKCKNY